MMLGIYSMLQDSGISQTDINQMDLVLFLKQWDTSTSKKIKMLFEQLIKHQLGYKGR